MVTVGIFLFKENSHGRAGNQTQDLMISSQRLWPLDHEAGLIFNILTALFRSSNSLLTSFLLLTAPPFTLFHFFNFHLIHSTHLPPPPQYLSCMKLPHIFTLSPQPQFWSSLLSAPFLSTLSLLSYAKNGCSIYFWKTDTSLRGIMSQKTEIRMHSHQYENIKPHE